MKRRLKERTRKGSIIFYSVIALIVVIMVAIVFVLYANYRNVSKLSELKALQGSELYTANAKGKDYYYVFIYASSDEVDDDVSKAVLDYATLIRRHGGKDHSYHLYALDTDDYENNHIVYSGAGVSTSILKVNSFDDIVIEESDLPMLIKVTRDHVIKEKFTEDEEISEELKKTTASIKYA